MTELLKSKWSKGTALLRTKYAILCGAMSWVSDNRLVSAISNAGAFGVIACGSLSVNALAKEIDMTRIRTDKSFGVNLITMRPDILELVKLCISHSVSHVVLAGGLPKQVQIDALKTSGVKTICFAPTLSIAVKLSKMGVDGLIIEGMEAGGHIGPVATSVLAQEILPHLQTVPIFVAGGIGTGEMIAMYLHMGASGCQLGTRFVCAHESPAHQNFKNAFIGASARDAVASVQIDPRFPVIPVRALANKATAEFMERQMKLAESCRLGLTTVQEAQLEIEHFWSGSLRRAVIDGDVEHGSLMAGQSVGMVDRCQSAQEIVDELVQDTEATLQRCARSLCAT